MKNNFMDTLESFQKDCCRPTKNPVKNQEAMKKELLAVPIPQYSCSTRDTGTSS